MSDISNMYTIAAEQQAIRRDWLRVTSIKLGIDVSEVRRLCFPPTAKRLPLDKVYASDERKPRTFCCYNNYVSRCMTPGFDHNSYFWMTLVSTNPSTPLMFRTEKKMRVHYFDRQSLRHKWGTIIVGYGKSHFQTSDFTAVTVLAPDEETFREWEAMIEDAVHANMILNQLQEHNVHLEMEKYGMPIGIEFNRTDVLNYR